MKFEEALKLMREGKKMANKLYSKDSYFYIDNFDNFRYHYKDNNGIERDDAGYNFLRSTSIVYNIWYEYKEPILGKEEKTYLEGVLKPFKNRVVSITKIFIPNDTPNKELHDNYRLDINVCLYDIHNVETKIQLPPFDATSSMYKGMEANRKYTLEELGLFEREN